VGWVKRGPSGLIGSNKPDAAETVQAMLTDLPELALLPAAAADPAAVPALLASRGVRVVDYAEWRRLDAREVERGKPHGRPRVKFLRLEEMLLELGAVAAGLGRPAVAVQRPRQRGDLLAGSRDRRRHDQPLDAFGAGRRRQRPR